MEYEIYADVVFAINFIMDMLIFWIAGKLSGMKINVTKLMAGSGISAGIYCVLALVPFFSRYYNFFTALSALLIGLIIAYNPKTIGNLLKLVIYSNISAFAFGGAVFAFFYFTNIGDILGNALDFSVKGFSLKILITATAATYIVIKLMSDHFKRITVKKQAFYKIEIHIEEMEKTLTALLDTGNTLSDPITSEPVIIAEFGVIQNLLPEDARDCYYNNRQDELLELMTTFSKTAFIKRVRIIPFSSLGKQHGMLIGFKPDFVHIIDTENSSVISKDVIIAIYNFSLSEDGSYQALLNPGIL